MKALSQDLESDGEDRVEVVIYGSRRVLELEDAFLTENWEGYRSPLKRDSVVIEEVTPEIEWSRRPAGESDERGARIQRAALNRAMEAAQSGDIDAIVTAPWNKALFAKIGEPVEGHTEVLARYFDAPEVVMMLAGPRLRVSLVTTHIALAQVAGALRAEEIKKAIRVTARSLQESFGLEQPTIAVCGLNPHAGEGGHMGREEIELIEPTLVEVTRSSELEGVRLVGPLPADTLFAKFSGGRQPFDGVICLYHDQGLIPLKLLHFGESANITLGLPVIRTSVDHGTAYDIAGEGIADEGSMLFALKMALMMARRRPKMARR